MPIKPVIRRKPVEQPEPEEDYEEELVEDVEEEEEQEPPKKRVVPPAPMKKVSPPVAKKPAPRPVVEEDEEVEDEEEEPEPPKKRVVPTAPAKKAAVAKEEVEDEEVEESVPAPKVKTVSTTVVDNLLPSLIQALENGKAIIITRISDEKWQVAMGTGQVAKQAMSAKEYEMTVYTPEYLQWVEGWKVQTQAEKVAFAKQNKINYPKHEDPRVEAIGLAEAVMEHLGIEKYKPEYERPSVRRALRGK